jgi:hypothetical protein
LRRWLISFDETFLHGPIYNERTAYYLITDTDWGDVAADVVDVGAIEAVTR